MRIWVVFCFFLFTSLSFAKSNVPPNCRAMAVSGETVTIKEGNNQLFLIHNSSDFDIWVTHPSVNQSESTRLQSGNWSALALEKPPFNLSCIESRPGHEQQIPCEGAVTLCKWKGVKLPKGVAGTFWAGEDLSLADLVAALGGRGFKLPDSGLEA